MSPGRECSPIIKREETNRTTMSTIHSSDAKGYQELSPLHTPLQLVPGAQALATSATLAMNEAVAKRRAAGRETIHLGFGEASFPLHPLLAAALADAAKEGADGHQGRAQGRHFTLAEAVG